MSEEYGLKFVVNGQDYDKIKKSLNEQIEDLQQKVEQLENENFNIRENIHLERISLPPELTKDKNFMELYDIPSYEDLKNKVEQLEKDKSYANWYAVKKEKEVEKLENIRKEAIESIERGYVVFCEQDKECLLNFRKNMLNILNKGSDKE